MANRITLKQIAEQLNISVSTVSRALNDKEYVKEETRRMVLQAVHELEYSPNEIARSLKTRTTKTIGIIVPDICETLFGMVIKGIDEVVSAADYSIMVSDTNEDKYKEQKYLDLMYQKSVDALVLATVDLHGEKILRFLNGNIPVVFIDNIPKISRKINSITIDNAYASQMAVQYLVDHGHRQIAAIFGSTDETTGYERRKGYLSACEQHDLEINEALVKYGNYKEKDGYVTMLSLLEQRRDFPFTAAYVTSEMMTMGAMKAIYDYGLKVPQDVSVIGFDVHDDSRLLNPTITSIKQPEKEIGNLAGELLINNLTGLANHVEQIYVEPFIEVGNSVKKI